MLPSRLSAIARTVVAIVFAAGFAPAQDTTEVQPSVSPVPVVTTIGVADASYRVASPDILRIEVFDEDDLTGDYQIAPEGTIMFPLLGQVPVSGLTVAEVTTRVHDLLEKDYLFDPTVSTAVKEYRSQKVEILGSVGRPGTYYLKGETWLLSLVAEAGGVIPSSTEVRRGQIVRIVRGRGESDGSGGSKATTIRVDLFDLLVEGFEEANIRLRDGDLVYVTRTEEIHVVGEVKRPGTYPYEEGMTVLKAVSLAGGPTNQASVRKVFIRRIADGEEVRLKADPKDEILPEDTVEVPLGFW